MLEAAGCSQEPRPAVPDNPRYASQTPFSSWSRPGFGARALRAGELRVPPRFLAQSLPSLPLLQASPRCLSMIPVGTTNDFDPRLGRSSFRCPPVSVGQPILRSATAARYEHEARGGARGDLAGTAGCRSAGGTGGTGGFPGWTWSWCHPAQGMTQGDPAAPTGAGGLAGVPARSPAGDGQKALQRLALPRLPRIPWLGATPPARR